MTSKDYWRYRELEDKLRTQELEGKEYVEYTFLLSKFMEAHKNKEIV